MSTDSPATQPTPPATEAIEARRREGRQATRRTQDAFAHELGVSFGDHPRQRMDLYFPDGEAKGPTLVFLHGGGFRGGDPGSVGHYGHHYLEAGVIYAAIGYRLLPDARLEGSCDDVEAGLLALAGLVADHGGDPAQIYLSGHSAGAVLAAHVGLRPSPAVPADLVKGLVLSSGMYHFENRDQDRYDLESPRHVPNLVDYIAHVPGHTILVAGDADFPAVLPDATALGDALRARGGSVESFVEPGADHFAAVRGFAAGTGPVFEATKVMMKL
jgi:acetyl esterase/lipase